MDTEKIVAEMRAEADLADECGYQNLERKLRAWADRLAKVQPEGWVEDARRLDALEAEVLRNGPIVLHNGEWVKGAQRGLGMRNTGRTIRQAIDDSCMPAAPKHEGWVLVPREPTEAMRTAHSMYGDTSDWWNAVITASPKHEGGSLDSRQGLLDCEGGTRA